MAVQITIRSLSGETVAVLPADQLQTVLELKQALSAAAGIAVAKQKLLAGASLLRNVDQLGAVLPAGDAAELSLVLTDKWVHEVAEDWRRLRKAPAAIRDDAEAVLEAIARSQGQAIKFAGDGVRANADVVLAAMRHDVGLAQYASWDLAEDVAFMLAAAELVVASSPVQRLRAGLYKWAWRESDELRANPRFVHSVVLVSGLALAHAAEPLRADRAIVSAAVKQTGYALQYAAEELRGDRELALLAVQDLPVALQYVSAELRADREFILFALQQPGERGYNPDVLQYASQDLRADREVVSLAVHRCAMNLAAASEELRSDRAIADLALQPGRLQNPHVARYVAEELQRDLGFMLPHVQNTPRLFESLCPSARADRKLALAAVERDGLLLRSASEELRADAGVVLAAVRQNPGAYHFIAEPLKASWEVAAVAVQKDWRLFRRLPSKLQSNRDVALAALRSRGATKAGKALQKMTVAAMVAEILEGP